MVAHSALSNNHTIGEVEPRESTFRSKPLGLELNVNEPVDRKNGGHIRHNDRLATQAPAESEILEFRPEGYDVYTGCHKSDNCGAASHWARRFLFSWSQLQQTLLF